ncbi:ABC transporter ATP-binding protein [Enterococcus columbae]|uniref:ABC transporter domain-containing protein n=1 Tax=Enterococcus columbae DSM 7374 = ATCC 51263 TaxID=1121865 RepID=S1MTC3_9ENTE|nr:ABC transporter ATP-binding protein [Enterococcus columbae]EOT39172.1 hypothetical protein OMW_02049 [Enterococcus columbae DSM 7374 = ATCC 51263]EOW79895.1 hypothetical protein I568_02246 [Enterococcus columbae DSM 7374 = ATCC 51263]OJG24516.1 hypothetical protein RR47_GL000239 [Enterococcus columbae DSM 7374 = ATCC 51263]
MPIVAKLSHALKQYDQKIVLDQVQLAVNTGEILGIIGPSGAGKTTLIQCLLGMEKLDAGNAQVLAVSMPNRSILKKVGYMGQNTALYERLTAYENLAFFGRLKGLKATELTQQIQKYSQLVNLHQQLNQKVQTFSGGMKRRLSLAITLLGDPDLLILDEPTTGIDPKLRLEIWQQLALLAKKQKGILLTTHTMDEAEKCDKLALIAEGKILAFGSPAELKQQFQIQTIEEIFLKVG